MRVMSFSEDSLTPIISEPIVLKILGCVYYGNPFVNAAEWSVENEIGSLWKRFINNSTKFDFILKKLNKSPKLGYEIHYEPDDYPQTKKYYVYVGIAVDYIDEIPLDLVYKPLPLVSYARFKAKVTNHEYFEQILQDWLISPTSGYKQAYPYIIQEYNYETYKGLDDPDSELTWLIPVVEK